MTDTTILIDLKQVAYIGEIIHWGPNSNPINGIHPEHAEFWLTCGAYNNAVAFEGKDALERCRSIRDCLHSEWSLRNRGYGEMNDGIFQIETAASPLTATVIP